MTVAAGAAGLACVSRAMMPSLELIQADWCRKRHPRSFQSSAREVPWEQPPPLPVVEPQGTLAGTLSPPLGRSASSPDGRPSLFVLVERRGALAASPPLPLAGWHIDAASTPDAPTLIRGCAAVVDGRTSSVGRSATAPDSRTSRSGRSSVRPRLTLWQKGHRSPPLPPPQPPPPPPRPSPSPARHPVTPNILAKTRPTHPIEPFE